MVFFSRLYHVPSVHAESWGQPRKLRVCRANCCCVCLKAGRGNSRSPPPSLSLPEALFGPIVGLRLIPVFTHRAIGFRQRGIAFVFCVGEAAYVVSYIHILCNEINYCWRTGGLLFVLNFCKVWLLCNEAMSNVKGKGTAFSLVSYSYNSCNLFSFSDALGPLKISSITTSRRPWTLFVPNGTNVLT